MWESYKQYSEEAGIQYDDDIVMDSITRTATIASEPIEDFMPDTKVRLPDFVVPEGMTATQALVALSIEGLKA